jgi:fatty-acyl-CoA synthase
LPAEGRLQLTEAMPKRMTMRPVEVVEALAGTAGDWLRRAGDEEWRRSVRAEFEALPAGITRTLPWLLRAREERDESLLKLALKNAEAEPAGLAVQMGDTELTWSDLASLTSRIAHVLADLGVKTGDTVVLIGKNSPLYLAVTLGISRVGATAALINYHLEGAPLSHAVSTSGARIAIAEPEFAEALAQRPDLSQRLEHVLTFCSGDLERRMDAAPAHPFERVRVPTSSDFVYIYTSGTTGLPKPCRVTHARALLAGAGFGPVVFSFRPGDKLYSVLPLYHSSALLIGVSSCFVTRTPLCLRDSFSVKAFWPDVQRYRATAILYIGELCRYLVNSPPCDEEKNNPVRIAVGNGLRADVWGEFSRRFGIRDVREFYSATEAPGAILNLTNKVGSIGHVPLRRLSPLKLARYDVERDELVRGADGLCVECGPDEVGELVIRLPDKPRSALGEFRGYTDREATERKILHDVFKPGDRFFRSGDLMRFDHNDYFYFVDRIGDTYRWKGENVSTAEVAEVIGASPGVRVATVSSVHVPGAEGQAGLAAVVCDGPFDATAFWRAVQELPSYAQPRFVRVLTELDTTGTFKIQKTRLRSDGVDPAALSDPIYLRRDDGYVPLTAELWDKVTQGALRL